MQSLAQQQYKRACCFLLSRGPRGALLSAAPPVKRMPGVCLELFAELCLLVSRLLEDKPLVLQGPHSSL